MIWLMRVSCARRPARRRPDEWDGAGGRRPGPYLLVLPAVEWSGRRDSNPRSLGPEPSAIPGFATSRTAVGESARSRTECTGETLLSFLHGSVCQLVTKLAT